VVGGRVVVVGATTFFVVDVLPPTGVVLVVVVPTGSVAGTLVADVLLVALVLLVTFVLLVTLVLVGREPAGRVVVVVVLVAATGAGHAMGAGAFRAANRPGLSLPILPPNRRQ